MEESLIWDTFKEYIPEKSKETAANQFVDFLLGKDVSTEDLEGLKGYDNHLDDAIDLVIEEYKSYDDDEEIDYKEDEDY